MGLTKHCPLLGETIRLVLDCASTKYHSSILYDMDFGVLKEDAILFLSHSPPSSQSDPPGTCCWQELATCLLFPLSGFQSTICPSPHTTVSPTCPIQPIRTRALLHHSAWASQGEPSAQHHHFLPGRHAHGWMNIMDTGIIFGASDPVTICCPGHLYSPRCDDFNTPPLPSANSEFKKLFTIKSRTVRGFFSANKKIFCI